MTQIRDSFLQAFNPITAIKITSIDNKPIKVLVDDIFTFIQKKKYESILDQSTNTIYLGKKRIKK